MTGTATTAEPLVLTAGQVPVGATVYICETGTSDPIKVEGGLLPPVKKRIGGVDPLGVRFYPVAQMERGGSGRSLSVQGYIDVPATTRFTPVEVFGPDDAPAGTVYAVFVNGERLMHGDSHVQVYKDADGYFITAIFFVPAGHHWVLPPEALLVPTSEVGEGKKP